MSATVDTDLTRDGYYCLAIALLYGCTVEKAIALYENNTCWITDDIIEEMRRMREVEGMSLRQMADIYGISKIRVLQYLRRGDMSKIGLDPMENDFDF